MEIFYLGCAGLGGTVILLQLLASAIGMGLDHDHDFDHNHEHGGNGFFGLLTLRSIAAAVCFFGLAGLSALSNDVPLPGTLAAATLGGFIALYSVASLMELFKKLRSDGTADLENALGTVATVYLRIPGGSLPGKVTLTLQNRTIETAAYAAGEIATGRPVRVVALRGDGVDVEAA